MCRLFGFRSVIQSQVHRSLVAAENALAVQAEEHPDGWGVAWYLANAPHTIKGTSTAVDDGIFARVSGVVASETVLAHIRKATAGDINTLNTHPFQFGHWVFAHNGQVRCWPEKRQDLLNLVAPNLRCYILGDTDSELLFFLFLSELSRRCDVHRTGTPIEEVVGSLRHVIGQVRGVCDVIPGEEASLLTMVVTDGATMVGFRQGKPLLFSTYKASCLDRDSCPFLAPECEGPTQSGHVNHLIISSEPLQGDSEWLELADGEVVGVDWRMTLHRGQADGTLVPIRA